MLSGKDKPWREPDGGNLHVRFDEGEGSAVIGLGAFHSVLPSLLYWLHLFCLVTDEADSLGIESLAGYVYARH